MYAVEKTDLELCYTSHGHSENNDIDIRNTAETVLRPQYTP